MKIWESKQGDPEMKEIFQLHALLQHRLTIKGGSLLVAGATEYESVMVPAYRGHIYEAPELR